MFAAKNRLIDDQPALPAGERIIELPSALEMEHNATVLLTCHAYNRYSRSPDVSSVISSKPHCFFLAPRVSILYSKKIKKEKKTAFYQSTSSTKKKKERKNITARKVQGRDLNRETRFAVNPIRKHVDNCALHRGEK